MCDVKNCELSNYEGHSSCILHCNKKGFDETSCSGEDFLNSLMDSIVIQTFADSPHKIQITKDFVLNQESMRKFLDNLDSVSIADDERGLAESMVLHDAIKKYVKDHVRIYLLRVKFISCVEERKLTKLLSLFKSVSFEKCVIPFNQLRLINTEVVFHKCLFTQEWRLSNYLLLQNRRDSIYYRCYFKNKVHAIGKASKDLELEHNQFYNCIFKNRVTFNHVHFKAAIFSSFSIKHRFPILSLANSKISGRFIVNNNLKTIRVLFLKKCLFKDKFELKSNSVNRLYIDDCNFEKVTDFNGTECDSIIVKKCVFDNFVGFEKLTVKLRQALFIHDTFNGIVSFREASFTEGLDLGKCNFSHSLNFLGVRIDGVSTRETFRVIKHSYDNVGNIIEANKFFSKEMEAHKNSFEKRWWSSGEALVFHLNHIISDFGQSYLKPTGWLFLFAVVYAMLLVSIDRNIFFDYLPIHLYDAFRGSIFQSSHLMLNALVSEITPINLVLKEGLEFLSLFFNLVFAVLIWHIVIAVKRLTRR